MYISRENKQNYKILVIKLKFNYYLNNYFNKNNKNKEKLKKSKQELKKQIYTKQKILRLLIIHKYKYCRNN